MPRMPKSEHEKRTKPVETWISPELRAHLKTCAIGAGVRFTDYVRDIVLTAELEPTATTNRLRSAPGRSGERLKIYLTLAEREEIHTRAARLTMTTADYIYRALIAYSGYEAEENLLRLEVDPKDAKRLGRRAAAANLPLCEFMVKQSLNGHSRETKKSDNADMLIVLDRLNKELKAIGNNVNQLAHVANAGRVMPGLWKSTAKELSEMTADVDDVIQKVASDYAP